MSKRYFLLGVVVGATVAAAISDYLVAAKLLDDETWRMNK